MRIMAIMSFFLFMSGCSAINHEAIESSAYVDPGMSKREVSDLLGPPQNRQFSGSNEAWQYCQTSVWGTTDKFVVVWFFQGQVTGLTSYTESKGGLCTSFFRSVNWEDAPDHTIEVRQR